MDKYKMYDSLLKEFIRDRAISHIETTKKEIAKKLEDSLEEIVASVMLETLLKSDITTLGDHFHVNIIKK